MNLPELCIRRPVMTTLVMLGILFFGIVAYQVLPVSELPNVDFPTINVSASLPGASPETMASAVATPLEQQFSTIAGITSMTSQSSLGNAQITLQFDLDRSIDGAAQDVQTAISTAQRSLPTTMTTPPTFRKVNPADASILFLTVLSPTLRISDVDEYAETLMAQRISMVSGVAEVSVFGSQKYAVRAEIDPSKLAAKKIAISDVADAIKSSNVNLPVGTLNGRHRAFTIQANGQMMNAAAFRKLIVAYRNGSPVRLGQLGKTIDSVENNLTASWFSNDKYKAQPSVLLAIHRQPGTNSIQVVNAVKKLLPQFHTIIPASVELHILHDHSTSIRASINDIKFSLLLAIFLVVLVIFLFLRTLSATIIPSVAMPLSIVATFGVMYFSGFTVDNLSLMALTLSVGFIVDDAIVVLENIVRHIEKGEPVMEASLKGSREIGFTIISMTLALSAVFIPVIFMGGVLGKLLHEFAITIGAAILVSGFISLTLTPMMCSRFLKPKREKPANDELTNGKKPRIRHRIRNRFYAISEGGFSKMQNVYKRTLEVALRHSLTMIVVLIALIVASGWLFEVLPKGFIPNEDEGLIFAFTKAAQNISFDSMTRHQKEVAAVIRKSPYVTQMESSIGGGHGGASNSGRMFIALKPRSERRSAEKVIASLRKPLSQIPGIKTYLQVLPSIRIGGQLTNSQYQFTLSSGDLQTLYHYAPLLEKKMRTMPGLVDVDSDLQIKNPQAKVAIDRDKASALGVTAAEVENALYYAYGQGQISTIYTPTDQFWVILEAEPKFQLDPAALSLLYVHSANGGLVPLSTVAKITRDVGPLSVSHLGQLPAVTLSYNLKPGVSLSTANAEVEAAARQMLPASISYGFQGTAQAFQSSLSSLSILLLMAVLVIYLVLGILYESFIHPLTILSGLPAASFGALLTLWIFGEQLNLYGFVGLLMLIGIVKKNAIMMIDFAIDAQRKEVDRPPHDAIYEACLVRFRPIMMTTLAAMMGTLPIALGVGAGAESRRSLGLAVCGGLIVSQLLTLYITPVVYIYLERFHQWIRHRGSVQKRPPAAELPAHGG